MILHNQKRGFTIPEVVFASGVMLVATSLVISLAFSIQKFARTEQFQNRIERETELLVNYLQRDIRSAVGFVAHYPAMGEDADALVMRLSDYDEDGYMTGSFHYIAYEVKWAEQKVVRTVYGDEEGAVVLDRRDLPMENCTLNTLVNGQYYYGESDPVDPRNVQIAVHRQKNDSGHKGTGQYSRLFAVGATLRNPSR